MKTLDILDKKCNIQVSHYPNGNTRLTLVHPQTGGYLGELTMDSVIKVPQRFALLSYPILASTLIKQGIIYEIESKRGNLVLVRLSDDL